jgi:exodeoxyribonuclease VII small subunit
MPDAPSPTFESALAELESIVERMEGGELPLKDALAAY